MCIRDRYEANVGQSPTSYLLGTVCMARNLEPRIPEECLVIQLSYHYKEGIKTVSYTHLTTLTPLRGRDKERPYI